MARQAYFGQPAESFVRNGAHVAVYLVPVFEHGLVVFDVTARQARGRWLPWDVMEFGANPYETAAALADDWCDGNLSDLMLVDVLSFPFEGEGWELAIVFRAQLTSMPAPDDARTSHRYPPGEFDAIGQFDPIDLRRWVERAPLSGRPSESSQGLVF
jgi:hypothetical protein